MTKKILLSLFTIVGFGLYVAYYKPETIWNRSKPEENPLPEVIPERVFSYRDGEFTGARTDAYYGYIQVKVTVAEGKIADILFLEYPNDRDTSITINDYATPLLRSAAIQAQSAQVDVVSGATDSSKAFRESLADALQQATL